MLSGCRDYTGLFSDYAPVLQAAAGGREKPGALVGEAAVVSPPWQQGVSSGAADGMAGLPSTRGPATPAKPVCSPGASMPLGHRLG